jgi:hypothetical protein
MSPNAGRFVAWAYAVGVYFVVLGGGLAVLSYVREPLAGKEYLHGVLSGLQLVFLAAPFLFFSRFSLGVAVTAAALAAGFWLLALGTLLVLLHPLEAMAALLRNNGEELRPLIVFGTNVVLQIGLYVMVAGAVGAFLDLAAATAALARRGLARSLATSALVGAGGASAILIALLLSPQEHWRFAPLTLDVRLTGSAVIVAVLVGVVAHRLAALREAPREVLADRRPAGAVTALLIAVEIVWLGFAPHVAPDGLEPPRLLIVADSAYAYLASDGSTERALADMEQRTGVATGVERILVIYRDPDGSRFASRHRRLPDASYLVTIDGTVDEERLHYVQRFQLANSLIQIHQRDMFQPGRVGFAYWAAHAERNAFVHGIRSGVSPESACAELPTVDFDTSSDGSIPLSSLPFVIAERSSGVDAAQALFADIVRTPPTTDEWTDRIADDCELFIARFAEPPLPELRVEAGAGYTALMTDGMTERFFAEAKARSGLDARGRAIVVRYAPTPPGKPIVDDSDWTTLTVTLSPALSAAQRRTAVMLYSAGWFITTRYGMAEPVRSAFADWVAQDPDNPFTDVVRSQARARTLCTDRAKYPMDGPTNGGMYLASAPFYAAERAGGVGAAQELMRATLTVGGQPDLDDWRERVEAICSRVLQSGTL